MFGDNPKRSIINNKDNIFEVKNIFKTIQGEGPNTGTPAIFLRLGGCNLTCSFCDTNFEDFQKIHLDDICDQIKKLSLDKNLKQIVHLVVITGGEPFRQNINIICKKLIEDNFKIQIETNGTLFRELEKDVEIICSPKAQNGKYYPIRPDLLSRINGFKFLISNHITAYNNVPEIFVNNKDIPISKIFIQPMDELTAEKNLVNTQLAVKLSLEYGYRISYQLHKILNIE